MLALEAIGAVVRALRRSRRPPGPGRRRAERVLDALVELLPVAAVFVVAGGCFGLGWLLPDMWFVGLVVFFASGIGFVVWCTRVIPWPRRE